MVTVSDPSGAVIPDATVTIVGLDDALKSVTIPPAKTVASGTATFEGLTPGRYSIKAEFPGFELGLLRDVRAEPRRQQAHRRPAAQEHGRIGDGRRRESGSRSRQPRVRPER